MHSTDAGSAHVDHSLPLRHRREQGTGNREQGFRRTLAVFSLALCSLFPVPFLTACAQNTEAPVAQEARQTQIPAADSTAQAGKYTVNTYIVNDTHGMPNSGGDIAAALGGAPSEVDDAKSDNGGSSAGKVRSGYTIAGVTLNITAGGSSTGSQSTAATGSQSNQPAATVTQSPEQKPEAQVSGNLGLAAPLGTVQQNAAGASGGSTTTLTPQQTNELRALIDKSKNGPLTAEETTRRNALLEQVLGTAKPAGG